MKGLKQMKILKQKRQVKCFDDKITIELIDNFPTKTVGFNERNDLENENMLNTFDRLEVSVIYEDVDEEDNSIVKNIQIRGLNFEVKI